MHSKKQVLLINCFPDICFAAVKFKIKSAPKYFFMMFVHVLMPLDSLSNKLLSDEIYINLNKLDFAIKTINCSITYKIVSKFRIFV